MNLPANPLTQEEVVAHIKTDSQEKLISKISAFYFNNGIEYWFEKLRNSLSIGDPIQEGGGDVFQLDKLNLDYADAVMWNFFKRVSESFD